MQLGWNEIRQRAVQFSREWVGETREEAEAKSFWDAFFDVFGIPRYVIVTDFDRLALYDLDRAVDRCCCAAPFTSDSQRAEFLFALYKAITVPLLPAEKKGRRGS